MAAGFGNHQALHLCNLVVLVLLGLLALVMVLRGFELFLFSNAPASFSSQTSLYPHLLGSSVTVGLGRCMFTVHL